MDLHLKDKRALITGASKGLGYATALQLAREGCRVVINARTPNTLLTAAERIAKETGSEPLPVPGDITDPEFPLQLVDKAVALLGGLDILITNAGGPPPGAFESFDESDWDQAIDISFRSHIRLIRAALPHLRRSESPSVLTITSITVKQPAQDLVLSNSVRAATVGLTKTLANELGPEGIRFNSILPGYTDTERVQVLMADRAEQNNTTTEIEKEKQSAAIPLKRIGDPQEFANAAVFLVSPAASYINGIALSVDGGAARGLL